MGRQKKYNLILFLIILVGAIGLGYAALGANLLIDGTTNLTRTTWDIHFDHIVETSGGVTPNSTTSINAAGDTVTYSITLSNPGDFYEFTVDAVNAGTIDAMIESVTSTLNNGSISNLPDCLTYSATYSDGVEIAPNHLLEAGTTETYKVRIEFKKDVEEEDLPDSNQALNLAFTVNYVQADSNAVAPSHASWVYTVNKYDSTVTTPKYNSVWLNQAFPSSITQYQTPSEALTAIATASSLDLPFYLKHKIENGIVTESYVEFVVTDAMAQANQGMVAGTYTLRGEKTYDSDTSTWLVGDDYISPYYETNKEAIKIAFGYTTNPSRCSELGTGHSSGFRCSVSGLYAYSYARGDVAVNDASRSSCGVSNNGGSYCYW